MAKLLELYGVRKGGGGEEGTVPSVADSWASRYLRERKSHQMEEREKTEKKAGMGGKEKEEGGEQGQHQRKHKEAEEGFRQVCGEGQAKPGKSHPS